jgi:hypothetical protein
LGNGGVGRGGKEANRKLGLEGGRNGFTSAAADFNALVFVCCVL